MITLTLGYFEALIVRHEDGRVAVFPGRVHEGRWRRILTGARDKYGQPRTMSSAEVRRFYRVAPKLRKVGDVVEVEDDKGLFAPLSPGDIAVHMKRAHGIIPTSPTVLAKVV